MTVAELIAHLETLPQEANVRFLGYGCGNCFYEDATESEFVLSNDTVPAVDIVADWN